MWFPFSRSSSSLISSSLTSSAKQNQVGLEKFHISAAPWEVNPCWNPHQASVSPGQQMLPAGNTTLTNSLGIGMWAAKLMMNIGLLIGIDFKEKHPAIRACSCAFSLLINDKNSCTQTSLLNWKQKIIQQKIIQNDQGIWISPPPKVQIVLCRVFDVSQKHLNFWQKWLSGFWSGFLDKNWYYLYTKG